MWTIVGLLRRSGADLAASASVPTIKGYVARVRVPFGCEEGVR